MIPDAETGLVIAIVRESIGLGILVIFLFLSWRIFDRLLVMFDKQLEAISDGLQKIVDAIKDD